MSNRYALALMAATIPDMQYTIVYIVTAVHRIYPVSNLFADKLTFGLTEIQQTFCWAYLSEFLASWRFPYLRPGTPVAGQHDFNGILEPPSPLASIDYARLVFYLVTSTALRWTGMSNHYALRTYASDYTRYPIYHSPGRRCSGLPMEVSTPFNPS